MNENVSDVKAITADDTINFDLKVKDTREFRNSTKGAVSCTVTVNFRGIKISQLAEYAFKHLTLVAQASWSKHPDHFIVKHLDDKTVNWTSYKTAPEKGKTVNDDVLINTLVEKWMGQDSELTEADARALAEKVLANGMI
jgi:hypothetical protein